jgi:hypothetical protein
MIVTGKSWKKKQGREKFSRVEHCGVLAEGRRKEQSR